MIRCSLFLISFVMLGMTFLQCPAIAMSVGVGLDWRKNMFVQEYWRDGKVFYAIANKADTDQTIIVFTRHDGKRMAGPWEVKANSLVHVDASALIGKDMLQFKLESGSSLGLMQSPVQPAKPPQAAIATYYGLNGSGGRHGDIWVEQDAPAFPSRHIVELRLTIPKDRGQLVIRKGDLARVEVSCETLKVNQRDDRITVDVIKPLVARDMHIVVLKFKSPQVSRVTMLTVDTWLWNRNKNGGHSITRGVVIEPVSRR